ncbi:MAG: TatD family hydrolase [Patescibacteria group bacterium]
MLIDTHCHLNFHDYKDDWKEALDRSLADDTWVINVGTKATTSRRAIEIAEQYKKGVYAIIGLHPIHIHEQDIDEPEQSLAFHAKGEGFQVDAYREMAKHEKVVGIGEMGIDYFHMPKDRVREEVIHEQKQTFLQGLELAQELGLPVTVHTRPSKGTYDAYDDVIRTIADSGYTKAVIHCFGGSVEQAHTLLDLGCLLSVTGIVTFKNAKDIQALIKDVPLDRLMVETDAPFLAPEPHRGTRNEPQYVRFIAEKVADLKGVHFEEVAETTTAVAKEFFALK